MAINRVNIVGRLTQDCTLRYTPTGKAVCQFTLAVDRQKKDSGADFLPIVVWDKLAELCAQFLSKGKLAAVDGRIATRNYDHKDGYKVYVTEIVAENVQFLSPADGTQNAPNNSDSQSYGQGGQNGNSGQSGGFGGGYKSDIGYGNGGGYGGGRDNDPFADDGKPISISDDDLPWT